jgi:hypothetical protein
LLCVDGGGCSFLFTFAAASCWILLLLFDICFFGPLFLFFFLRREVLESVRAGWAMLLLDADWISVNMKDFRHTIIGLFKTQARP